MKIAQETLKRRKYVLIKTPNNIPLKNDVGRSLPTILIALDIEVPDSFFKPPDIFAEIKVINIRQECQARILINPVNIGEIPDGGQL